MITFCIIYHPIRQQAPTYGLARPICGQCDWAVNSLLFKDYNCVSGFVSVSVLEGQRSWNLELQVIMLPETGAES